MVKKLDIRPFASQIQQRDSYEVYILLCVVCRQRCSVKQIYYVKEITSYNIVNL